MTLIEGHVCVVNLAHSTAETDYALIHRSGGCLCSCCHLLPEGTRYELTVLPGTVQQYACEAYLCTQKAVCVSQPSKWVGSFHSDRSFVASVLPIQSPEEQLKAPVPPPTSLAHLASTWMPVAECYQECECISACPCTCICMQGMQSC